MPNIYQSHKAIYNNVKTIEELNLKGLLVFLLNRVEKAVSSGGETKGALIVICFNGRKSDKRIGKENCSCFACTLIMCIGSPILSQT